MPHPELLPELVLRTRLKAALARAFGAEHQDTDPLLRRSDRAHYQVNVAMSLGKALRRPPREVAQALLAELDLTDLCTPNGVEVAGPGFINLTLRDEVLASALAELLAAPNLGVPRADVSDVCVIDYGSPNIAKEMHVGHLRSSIIGDTLCRVLAFRGHTVIRQNHIGDWGTPFGMLIEQLVDEQQQGAALLDPSQLGDFYRAARAKFDADPGFADRARARVVSLQAGEPETLKLWQQFVDGSKRYMAAVFEQLGVGLLDADVRGESFFNPKLPEITDELLARGIAVVDDGAVCVFPPGFAGREGEPLPLIVRKKDGGYGYGATDLAALRFRREELGGTRLLYVVGTPQQQHLAMVFAVAKMAGWLTPPVRAEHVAFGSVLGDDRKMLKTRSGENIKLIELLAEAVERAAAAVLERNPELPEAERAVVARQVGIGAVKYADLSSDRIKDYVFDWKRMVAFEGNTGGYLQYAHARIRSILRKAESDDGARAGALSISAPAERALALELLSFARTLAEVETSLEPHKLCGYLYGLASSFSTFFQECPVLKSEPQERASRLSLCALTARTLATGLELLGIEAPERM
ncbi:MAG TPA: arginine--tRNA ligase [Polyangiaceae bacterium]|nr:arginine--tRNA ligase [Polyangiaceae bacterium]